MSVHQSAQAHAGETYYDALNAWMSSVDLRSSKDGVSASKEEMIDIAYAWFDDKEAIRCTLFTCLYWSELALQCQSVQVLGASAPGTRKVTSSRCAATK